MSDPSNWFGVASRARPRRVAFLVDPCRLDPVQLDALMRANYRVWGGRLNPIVPVDGGSIAESWWSLLRYVDADVVYTYAPLSTALIDRIESELAPLRIEAHPARFEPFHQPTALDGQVRAYSVYPLLVPGGDPLHTPKAIACRAPDNWPDQRLLERNFGLPTPDAVSEPPRYLTNWLEIQKTWDLAEVLRHLSIYPGGVLPLHAASAHSQLPDPSDDYRRDFCVAVGDDVGTWLQFWNRPISLNDFRRSMWNGICLPLSYFDDPGRVAALRGFMSRYGHFSGSNPPWLDLLSCSVTPQDLDAVQEKLSPGMYGRVRGSQLDPSAYPTLESRQSTFLSHGGFSWTRDACPIAVQQASVPGPLLRAPETRLVDCIGVRMLDLRVEHVPAHRFYENEQLWWKLPRRRALAHLFAPRGSSRVNSNGYLSVEASDAETFSLTVPPETRAVFVALGIVPEDTQREGLRWTTVDGPYRRADLSDKARYAHGVLELFGGLQQAGSFFQNSFWRSEAEKLAGASGAASDEMLRRLRQKFEKYRESIGAESAEWLADVSLRLTREERALAPEVTLDELWTSFTAQLSADMSARVSTAETSGELLAEQRRMLREEVQRLVDRGILLQGTNVKCRSCGTVDWREVSDLQQRSVCRGCRGHAALPVDGPWRFRINGLVGSAIALHGCVSVISALHDLRGDARESFLFLPGVELRRTWDDRRALELDIVCVIDGKLVIGEVKQSDQGFGREDVRKLALAARELHADRAVVAAFRSSKQRLGEIGRELTEQLRGTSCTVDTRLPDEHAFAPRMDP